MIKSRLHSTIDTVAAILVGGHSRRMGRPKALIEFDGTTLLERTVVTASGCVDRCILVGAAPFEMPESLSHLPILSDDPPNIGPIGGLAAALTTFPTSRVLLLACDMPRLTGDAIQTLLDDPSGKDAVVAETIENGVRRSHPCCTVYAPNSKSAVLDAIRRGIYSMTSLLNALNLQVVRFEGATAAALENWNAPSDITH